MHLGRKLQPDLGELERHRAFFFSLWSLRYPVFLGLLNRAMSRVSHRLSGDLLMLVRFRSSDAESYHMKLNVKLCRLNHMIWFTTFKFKRSTSNARNHSYGRPLLVTVSDHILARVTYLLCCGPRRKPCLVQSTRSANPLPRPPPL